MKTQDPLELSGLFIRKKLYTTHKNCFIKPQISDRHLSTTKLTIRLPSVEAESNENPENFANHRIKSLSKMNFISKSPGCIQHSLRLNLIDKCETVSHIKNKDLRVLKNRLNMIRDANQEETNPKMSIVRMPLPISKTREIENMRTLSRLKFRNRSSVKISNENS